MKDLFLRIIGLDKVLFTFYSADGIPQVKFIFNEQFLVM